MEKIINTRIALRIDTLANWSKTDVEGKGAKLVLKRGEIGLCEIPSGNATAQTAPTVLFKVGDGTTPFGELKWASALAADVYSWAKADDVVLEEEVIKFKKGTEVVKSIDLSKFALNSELTQAIKDLEAADAALGARIDKVVADAYDDTEIRGLITKEVSDREAADLVLEGKIGDAQEAAENAQKEVDALEGVVSALNGTVSSEIARVAGLIEDEADAREAADQAIEAKIGTVAEGKTIVGLISDAQTTVEGKVTALENGQVKTNKEAIETIKNTYVKTSVYDADKAVLEEAIAANTTKIGTDIAAAKTELQGYADGKASEVQGNLNTHISTYNTKVQALEGADSTLDGKINQEVKDRGSEIARVEGLISTEKSRAEGIEAGLRTDITNIQNNIASGLHFRGIKEALSDITDPANGDIVIVGTQEYIYDGSSWEEFGNAEAHATVDYVNTELGKKVNSSVYDSKVAELVAEDADIRADFAAADASLKSELEGKINGKVAQDDFDTLKGRVDGHDTTLGTKLDKSEFTEHIAAQASVDSNQNDRIKAVEDSLKDGGTINDLIKAAQAQADKGVADAKAAQDDVDALVGKVGTISGEKTLVEQLAAVKATADSAAVKSEVDATIANINSELAKKALGSDLTALTTRVTTAEGKITTAEGNITTLQGKVTALEGTYTNAQVDKAISDAVNVEKTRAEAAEAALDSRIDAYDARFGTASDILVFNCGDSVTNI